MFQRKKPNTKWEPLTRYMPKPGQRFLGKGDTMGVADLQELAHDLVLWAQEDDSINFGTWMFNYKIGYDRFSCWARREALFAEAISVSKAIIGARREKKILIGEHNATTGGRWLPYWVEPYKDHLEWESKLKNPDVVTGENRIVVIEKFPNSPDVPELKKNEQ